MTIHYPKTFNECPSAGFDGIFDWDFLKGCWGGSIQPTDIDGIVERFGRVLMFETKTTAEGAAGGWGG